MYIERHMHGTIFFASKLIENVGFPFLQRLESNKAKDDISLGYLKILVMEYDH